VEIKTALCNCLQKMALKPDNDVPWPENIQIKDKIYPPVNDLAGISTQRW